MRKKEKPAPVLDEKGRPPLKLDYPQTFKVGFAFAIIMLFWTAYDFVVPLLWSMHTACRAGRAV